MIASDTSRSRVYLQSLIKHDLIPKHVIILESDSSKLLPGQMHVGQLNKALDFMGDQYWRNYSFDLNQSIKSLLDNFLIPYDVIICENINAAPAVAAVRQRQEANFIYSGFGGVILKKEILSLNKNFLHVHGGYLPKYKGSTTNYFSLLNENSLGASSIFLREEIDSGPILMRRLFPAPKNRVDIDHFYDSVVRAVVLVETIKEYILCKKWKFEMSENLGGEVYYVIHPVLKHIAILGGGVSEVNSLIKNVDVVTPNILN